MFCRNQGVLALYSGISASLLRQLTYSTTRFAIYEMAKQSVSPNGEKIGFGQSLMMAAVAGGCGGVVGTPGDMVNVRMQNDVKLPPEQRRKLDFKVIYDPKYQCQFHHFSYKHAIDS